MVEHSFRKAGVGGSIPPSGSCNESPSKRVTFFMPFCGGIKSLSPQGCPKLVYLSKAARPLRTRCHRHIAGVVKNAIIGKNCKQEGFLSVGIQAVNLKILNSGWPQATLQMVHESQIVNATTTD